MRTVSYLLLLGATLLGACSSDEEASSPQPSAGKGGSAGKSGSAGADPGGNGGVAGQAGGGGVGGAGAGGAGQAGAGGSSGTSGQGGAGEGGQAGGAGAGASGAGAGGAGSGGESGAAGAGGSEPGPVGVESISQGLGPLSGGTYATVKGYGFSKGARVFVGKGRASARVVDDKTLLLQTPPGEQGQVDVRVVTSEGEGVLPKGFSYLQYQLETTWEKVSMSSARGNWPGVAVLQDGRVLITGGVVTASGDSVTATADLFSPETGQTKALASKMSVPRWTQSSVPLLTGKVLILGTWYGGASWATPDADLFDPTTEAFAPTAAPPPAQAFFPHATLLPDGRVLIASTSSAPVQLYNPETDSFSVPAGGPTDPSSNYWPTRLQDGRILLVQGAKSPLYVFDPDTDTFSQAGTGPTALNGALFTLPDGRVLHAGGTILGNGLSTPTDAIELYDEATQSFAPASYKLTIPKQRLSMALAGDGTVMVIGGNTNALQEPVACAQGGFLTTDVVDRINPALGQVSAFTSLPDKNFVMTAATLLSGSIVAAGGAPCGDALAYPYFYYLKSFKP